MLSQLSNLDKVSIVGLAKQIESQEKTQTIRQLATQLGVALMSENRNRLDLLRRISTPKSGPSQPSKRLALAKVLIAFLLKRSGAIQTNHKRHSFSNWFKDLIISTKDSETGASYEDLSALTGISIDTLTGFRSSPHYQNKEPPLDKKSLRIAEIWNQAPHSYRKNLDSFWYYIGKKYSDLQISNKELRQTLINLGLRYPRGPKTKNHGTQVKEPYHPHAIWEGDGKQMKITINGTCYDYLWYAFTDQNTTLLVGSSMTEAESAESFLTALKQGGFNAGTYPIGVLIDNRLSDTDLSPIDKFCKEHNIVLVRTFPGNSKSNGNIENNFSIFERYVGDINITGATTADIAKSVAQAIVEIFTELRNHRGRNRLNGETPTEAAAGAERPEKVRDAIEGLANRFDRENRMIDEKWQLIEVARKHFGSLLPESEQKIKRQLGNYTTLDIIAAQAAYLAQIAKYPDNSYRSEYFMAILRHKRETEAKHVYNEAYRAGIEKLGSLVTEHPKSPTKYAQLIIDEFVDLQNEPTPTQRMLRLEAISWWMVDYSTKNSIHTLWAIIVDLSEKTLAISQRFWQSANEYLSKRIGKLLYSTPCSNRSCASETISRVKKQNCVPDNLSTLSDF